MSVGRGNEKAQVEGDKGKKNEEKAEEKLKK